MLTRTTTPGGNTSTIDFGLTETVLTSSTTTTAKYYFVAGQRVAEQVGSTFSYLIPNLEGSPTVALSSTGYVSAVQLFLPYGASGFAWGTMPTAHNYTDQLLDSVMGLLYYGARWYDPLADQFVSADSVQGNPGGMNPYGYVGGNPETFIDPTGHFENPEAPGGDGGGSASGGDGGGFDASANQYINYEQNSDVVRQDENALDGVDADPAEEEQQLEQFQQNEEKQIQQEKVKQIQQEEQKTSQQQDQKPTENNQDQCGDGLSFVYNTPVATANGEQAIGTLKVGEKVWAYNPQTKKMELEQIQKIWLNHDNYLVDVTLIATVKDAHGKTSQKQEILHTNEKHPFLTKEKGFIPVSQLKPGMHVLEADGSYGVVAKLAVVPGAQWMYNLTVSQDHTYTVGLEQWIVHNTSCPQLAQQAQQTLNNSPSSVRAVTVTDVQDPFNQDVTGVNGPPGEDKVGNEDAANGLYRGQCSETHCAAATLTWGNEAMFGGNEINMGLAHRGGIGPCDDCFTNLQSLADQLQMNVNLGYYDLAGNYFQLLFEPRLWLLFGG